MKLIETPLDGVVIIEPEVFGDSRGYFLETYQQQRYTEAGIDGGFLQDNLSFSLRGTLRGLHYQVRRPQAKLVQAITGEVFDVAVDIRPESPTFGQWTGVRLSADNHRQLFLPQGCAHGFCVLSETACFQYKCTDYYAPEDEGGIIWNDPDLAIEWPIKSPLVSPRDALLPRFAHRISAYPH